MKANKKQNQTPLGVILAGGRSRRMGFDKSFALLNGRTLIADVYDALSRQLSDIVINTNSTDPRYLAFGCPVICDLEDFATCGPLGGIVSGLSYAATNHYHGIITVAVDTPYFPPNLVQCLLQNYQQAQDQPLIAQNQTGLQPTFAFWPTACLEQLSSIIKQLQDPSIRQVAQQLHARHCDFTSDDEKIFLNINTIHDITTAENL